jgi:hypothetical protein
VTRLVLCCCGPAPEIDDTTLCWYTAVTRTKLRAFLGAKNTWRLEKFSRFQAAAEVLQKDQYFYLSKGNAVSDLALFFNTLIFRTPLAT